MYRRILVPLDGSSLSSLQLQHAVEIVGEAPARLRLIHVLDAQLKMPGVDAYAMPDRTSITQALRAEARSALEEAQDFARRKGLEAEIALLETRAVYVSDVILDEAEKWRADLLVMGTHGRRGLHRLLMGSDAERVLRDAPVPVLLVRREGAPGKRVRRRAAPARARSAAGRSARS
jgi:nucleotide-binding universal stress UspA family protein